MNKFVQHMLHVDTSLDKTVQLIIRTRAAERGDTYAHVGDLGQHIDSLSDSVSSRCFPKEKFEMWLCWRDSSSYRDLDGGSQASTLVEKQAADLQTARQQLEAVCSSWCVTNLCHKVLLLCTSR